MDALSVVCWRWSALCGPAYVARLQSTIAANLRLPFRIFCITDEPFEIDGVQNVAMPLEYADTSRYRRRMWQYSKYREAEFGGRMLCVDLKAAIVGDITALVDRPDRIVCWRESRAVYNDDFLLFDTGALHGVWSAFKRNPAGFLKTPGERNGSDRAMVNGFLRTQTGVAHWTDSEMQKAVSFGGHWQ